MNRSRPPQMTHSYARIVFSLGMSLTTTRFDSAQVSMSNAARWQCGCSSTGPVASMVWDACSLHAHYTAVLDEERTSTLLSTVGDSFGMRFGDHAAMWAFDPSNTFCEKKFRAEYLSILHACGTVEGDFFAAELIYRELISNALQHAPGKVNVELEWSERHPVLSVHDHSGLFLWAGGLPLNLLNEHGRGLYLVKSLARELRIKTSGGDEYKISAVLPVERKSHLSNLFDFPEVATGIAR